MMREAIHRGFLRWQLTPKKRRALYEAFELMSDNGIPFYQGLKNLYPMVSDGGKHPTRVSALVLQDAIHRMGNGASPVDSLVDWLPADEAMLIRAGQSSHRLSEGFRHAIDVLDAKQRIREAVSKAVTYPGILMIAVGFLLNLMAVKVVPQLERVVPHDAWQGAAGTLRWVAHGTHDYGLWVVWPIIFVITLAISTLGWFIGKARTWVEGIPPWSVYRRVHGSTFLLSVAVLLRSGVRLHEALLQLSKGASPWLKERIEAIRYGIGMGSSFGQALANSGFVFPDKMAIQYVQMLSSFSGFEEPLYRFSQRWLAESVKRIEEVGKGLLTLGVVVVGALMAMLFLGINEIQQAMVK